MQTGLAQMDNSSGFPTHATADRRFGDVPIAPSVQDRLGRTVAQLEHCHAVLDGMLGAPEVERSTLAQVKPLAPLSVEAERAEQLATTLRERLDGLRAQLGQVA